MADRVVLHVGVLKSGTSYVQQRMLAAVDTLAAHGVLFPFPWNRQVVAVSDVLGVRRRARGDFDGAWERLVAEIDAWPGTAVVSMEFLGPARDEHVARVVGSFPDARVEVVVTARDLNRTIPAMWQESLKNAGQWTFEDYVEAIRLDEGVGSRFWRQQRLGVIVRRWAAHVGTDRVTLVTLPPPGAPAETLWLRFCEAAGIDPALCPPAPPANESLGVPSAEVLRLVNEHLAGLEIPWQQYSRHVKFGFAKDVLAGHRGAEPSLGMPVPPWVERRAASMRTNLAAIGTRVVGSLDDLVPVDVHGSTPLDVSTEDTLAAAVHALAALLRRTVEAELSPPEPPLDSPRADVVGSSGPEADVVDGAPDPVG